MFHSICGVWNNIFKVVKCITIIIHYPTPANESAFMIIININARIEGLFAKVGQAIAGTRFVGFFDARHGVKE